MTNQEFFDEGVARVIRQGKPAYFDGRCLYFDPASGCSCLVGGLIVERGLYVMGIEGSVVDQFQHSHSTIGEIMRKMRIPVRMYQFVGEMQQCHDGAARNAAAHEVPFMPLFIQNARQVAIRYRLSDEIIDKTLKETANAVSTQNP